MSFNTFRENKILIKISGFTVTANPTQKKRIVNIDILL